MVKLFERNVNDNLMKIMFTDPILVYSLDFKFNDIHL